jgi:uncharacterized membrane protein
MHVVNEMMESWSDPASRHAMVVHFPIVLSILGVPLAIATLAWPKRAALRWIAVALFVVMAATSWVARGSGHLAENGVSSALSIAGDDRLEQHEDMGDTVWLFAVAVAGCLAGTAIPRAAVRIGAGVIGSALALGCAAWVGVTAHHGGALVYVHGAVVPSETRGGSGASGEGAAPAADPRLVHFHAEVRPILETHCWGCHNPNRAERSGELDMTSIASILKGGESGDPAVVPGNLDVGELLIAVSYEDDFLQMPPAKQGGKLPDSAIAALRQWVAEGAVWPQGGVEGEWEDEAGSQEG